MSDQPPPSRRRFLRAAVGLAATIPLAGCLGSDDAGPSAGAPTATDTDGSSAPAETLGERPMPADLVGSGPYVDALGGRVERDRFPDPDADLLPELTKARFVAAAATDAGEDEYAERVSDHRGPAFEPLHRFDAVVVLSTERRREQLNETQRERLLAETGLDDENVSWDDDRAAVVTRVLDDRELTFFDYPAPPHHLIEAAESTGLDRLDRGPDERAEAVAEAHRPYVRQRAQIEAVVVGAREVAMDAYDDASDRLRQASPTDWEYTGPEDYAEVVAFNASLAAESMLASDGKLPTPP